ncbi:Ubiquitin carboxyl-terminal hydrolase 3 [Geodia barretti]|uniref:ubiquitinyl hydrolase 1 n=1 Tax=Geodia barretti TaxID=519541 RepID=A0AA35QXS8_GEOBA|nr:Ubiquitin carboxyl-terminal hydrolase 3 [Geodia barretti]
MNLCLKNVSNLLDLEYFCLKTLCVHSQCMGMMHHSVSSGHYTAYAFSPKSGLWYHFDDSTVTETTPKRVESCRAYILFYIRRDTSNGKYHHNSRQRKLK